MALKKCYKLHKLFLSELERCQRIDSEGTQVLSSLANVGARVPLLSASSTSSSTSTSARTTPSFGVLGFSLDTPALLLQKHLVAMEKSALFLLDIVRDFHDCVRRLRGFVDEFADLVDEALQRTETLQPVAVRGVLQLREWMENVRTMLEREALRKRLLVRDVEFQDVLRLERMHREWSMAAASRGSYVDAAYVRMGTEALPPLPLADMGEDKEEEEDREGEGGGEDTQSNTKKKTKSKKNKKPKQATAELVHASG